jgi:hypothetical protein
MCATARTAIAAATRLQVTRLASGYVCSDRARADGRPEWVEVMAFSLCDQDMWQSFLGSAAPLRSTSAISYHLLAHFHP